MILRLWALYTRSKFIIVTLLTLYAMETITHFVYYILPDAHYPQTSKLKHHIVHST